MLLCNGTIVTVDAQRRIWKNGAIVIEGSRIADIGKTEDMKRKYPQQPIYDLKGRLVIPGLIDCHVHTAQAISRCAADDMPLKRFLEERVWVLQGSFTEEDAKISCELNVLEMIKSGTTSFIECMVAKHYNFDNIVAVIRDSGMRACVSRIVMDETGYAGGSTMPHGMVEGGSSLAAALALHEKWNNAAEGRIRVWFGPRSTGSCSLELLRQVGKYSEELNMGVTMHYAQGTQAEVAYIREHFHCPPWKLLETTGLCGKRTVLVHGVWLDEDDIRFLAESGTHLVHCASSNAKIGMGTAKIPDMVRQGVNVCLGCDGGVSNNTYDMLQEMKVAACIHKGFQCDPEILPVETILEMATINGAKAMGMEDEIGSLEIGKRADLAILDPLQPHLTPSSGINPIATLVFCALGSDVEDVMIDGRWVMKHRQVQTMNEMKILKDAIRIGENLYQKNHISIASPWPML